MAKTSVADVVLYGSFYFLDKGRYGEKWIQEFLKHQNINLYFILIKSKMFKPQAFFHCFILAIFIIIFLCAQIYDVVDTLVFCKRHGTGKVQDSDGHHITYDVSSSLSSVLMTNIMWCKFCTKKIDSF